MTPRYAVSMVYMTGVRTVKTFNTIGEARTFAVLMANQFKGCNVYLGELVERLTMENSDDTHTES